MGKRKHFICTVPGCGFAHFCRGYCRKHHYRFKAHGDPLMVKQQSTPARDFFEQVVMTCPRHDCLIWPFSRGEDGYGRFRIDGKQHVVSRLVCERTHGTPPTALHEAAHSCGKGSDGCVNPHHLRWATRQENMDDMRVHGTNLFGEIGPAAKLKEADVLEIRRKPASQYVLARKYGVDQSTISDIQRGKSWKHLPIAEDYAR